MKEKVASPTKKRGNQSPKASSSPQSKSPKEEDNAKKSKKGVSWGMKAKKGAGGASNDASNSKISTDGEVKKKTPTTAKNTNVDLEAARIVTIAMVHASLAVKKQQQKKNIRAEAKAIAWKSIANAAIELRCN